MSKSVKSVKNGKFLNGQYMKYTRIFTGARTGENLTSCQSYRL